MDESLAWLRYPQTAPALGDLLCGLIRDIRLILVHSDLGSASKLAAITQTVDQLAPPPGPEASGARTAAMIVAMLARNDGPATILFEKLAGERIRIELTGCDDRPLTAAEQGELYLGAGAVGHQRTGTLRTAGSGLAVAAVTSVVVPDRLPAAARRALGIPGPDDPAPPPSAIPLGKVLAELGVRREPLGARLARDSASPPGGGVAVESAARMWLGDLPVALAGERVTAQFCQRVGGLPASADQQEPACARAASSPRPARSTRAPLIVQK
jgi:hypothetical protein